MPVRSAIAQGVQIGVETTEGTGVPANKKLTALGIRLQPRATFASFKATGAKYPSTSPLGKEWSSAELSGRLTYNEIVYPLSSVITTAAVTTPSGTLPRLWTFTPLTNAADNSKSFSVERGDGSIAEKVYGLKVVDFGIAFNRETIELSGACIAKAIQTGATLTATPTTVPLVAVLPNHLSLYMDPTSATLGATKLLLPFTANFEVSSRFGPVWVLDAAQSSYVATVETDPDTDFSITMMADTVGNSLFAAMRADTMKYFRLEAVNTQMIEAAVPYKFTLDVAAKIAGEPQYSEVDGAEAITWPMKAHDDGGSYGMAYQIKVQNAIAAL